MATTMTDEDIYNEATKRVKAKRDFYSNLGSWAAINAILIVIWALTSRDQPGVPWFLWPLCIWGAVVIINFLTVFVIGRTSDIGAVEKEAEKIKREQG